MALALMYYPTPTRISFEVAVSRVEMTLGVFPTQQMLNHLEVQSISFGNFSKIEFHPSSLRVADPKHYDMDTDSFSPEAWQRLTAAKLGGITGAAFHALEKQIARALAPPKTRNGPFEIKLGLVPGGTFTMGSAAGEKDERPPHQVTLATFYMGKLEVTARQFDAFQSKREKLGPALPNSNGRLPALNVTFAAAQSFCEHLTRTDDPEKARWRLPTEAEWEYAARGAEGREYPWGDRPPTRRHANFHGAADGYSGPAPVGSFTEGATPAGIFDLAGNAAEWCADWYGAYATGAKVLDPSGPAEGDRRVVRGGAYRYGPELWSRAAARVASPPQKRSAAFGFRVVRELTSQERDWEQKARE